MKKLFLTTLLFSTILCSCSFLKCSIRAGATLNTGEICLTCKSNDTITIKKMFNVKLYK